MTIIGRTPNRAYLDLITKGGNGNGSSDNTAAFVAANAELVAAGGGTILLPRGTFKCLGGFSLSDKVRLEGGGMGVTTLDFSAATTFVNGYTIEARGTLTSLPALAANIALNAITITFASTVAATVVAGDVLIISNSADSSWNPDRTYYRAGEFARVQSVAGAVVTLTKPTFDDYVSGGTVTVSKVNPVRVGISDLSIINKSTQAGIGLMYVTDFAVRNVSSNGSTLSNVATSGAYDGVFENVHCFDVGVAGGTNYGLIIGYSQRIQIRGGFFDTTRHGLAMGSGQSLSMPNRDILVDGAYISSSGNIAATHGADCHGNAEFVTFQNCILPRGIGTGGDNIVVQGCRIGTSPDGFALFHGEMIGWNFSFINNDITVTDNHGVGYAVVRIQSAVVTTRTGGVCRVAGNRMHCGPYVDNGGIATKGFYIYLIAGGATDNSVVVEDNEIDSTYTTSANASGIYVRGGFKRARVADNTLIGLGILMDCTGSEVEECVGNSVHDSRYHGINVSCTTTAVKRQIVTHNTVVNAQRDGIRVTAGAALPGTISIVEHNRVLAAGLAASGVDYPMHIFNATTTYYRHNIVGDDQSTPTILAADRVLATGTLYDQDNEVVGSVATRTRSTVTATHLRRRGSGTPEGVVPASPGSVFYRTDGGASSSFYVKETGTGNTGWRAV